MSCVLVQVNKMRHRGEFWGLEMPYVCSSLIQWLSQDTRGCVIYQEHKQFSLSLEDREVRQGAGGF